MNKLIQRRMVQLLAQARQLEEENRNENAVQLREEVCQLATDHLGEDHPYRTSRLLALAAAYRRSGKLTQAEVVYRDLIDRLGQAPGEESITLARSLNALGVLYCETKRHEQSIRLFERALHISRLQLPADDPGFAAIFSNLAGAHHVLRQFPQAKRRYLEALECYQRAGTGALVEQAHCHVDLAELAAETREGKESAHQLQKALLLYRSVHPTPEPPLAEALVRLALVAHRIGRTSQAMELLEEATEIFQNAGQEEELASCLERLSEVQQARST